MCIESRTMILKLLSHRVKKCLCILDQVVKKVCRLELQNSFHHSKKILTTPCFLASRVWKELILESQVVEQNQILSFTLALTNILFSFIKMDFSSVNVNELMSSIGIDKLVPSESSQEHNVLEVQGPLEQTNASEVVPSWNQETSPCVAYVTVKVWGESSKRRKIQTLWPPSPILMRSSSSCQF